MTKHRWLVVATAFLAIIITYLDRSALSYAIGPLERTFHLTNTQFGEISAAFGVGYLFMTVIGGILVDRYGSRKIWSIFAVIWSVACALIGFATGYAWLFALRLFLGLSEGPSFPAFTRVATDWLPVSERGRALGIGLAAVPFSSVIGAPLVTHLMYGFGWRIMFVILGSFGVLWSVLWLIIFRDKPEQSKMVSAAELQHIQEESETKEAGISIEKIHCKTTWKFILLNPAFIANNYAFFSFGYLLFFAISWLPGYLEQTYHLKIKSLGWFLIAPWSTATVLLLLGGWLSDYLWRKTNHIRIARSHLIWICQILSALCFIPVIMTHSLTISLIGISLGVGLGLMPNSAFYAINADLARDKVATSLGVMTGAFGAAGILAPLLTGILSTVTGNFSGALILLIGFTLTSALGIILFQHPDKSLMDKHKY